MVKKLLIICVFTMIFGVMFSPGSSFAFKSITRDQLIYDAIEFCPSELKKYLLENIHSVSAGNHFAEIHKRRSFSIDPYETEAIYNTAHAFGVIACFIAETISPDNFKTPQHLIPDDVKYDGFQEVGDVKSNISGLIKNYRITCLHAWDKEVTEALYNVAVNEIADYWTSAWEKGGLRAGTFASGGEKISHQNLVLNLKVIG